MPSAAACAGNNLRNTSWIAHDCTWPCNTWKKLSPKNFGRRSHTGRTVGWPPTLPLPGSREV
eukprot:CAMPEP_0117537138 /NCGR_PEP_ID=MMETSP0784-20121206/41811_1 /TAXON_ID=39447 /ORGANISM="" /LENGTH=61 /DNA_ID=CAMNT_0005333717 /DNA_START=614 /DNA_END=799 /DNA_ORIENTATION=+